MKMSSEPFDLKSSCDKYFGFLFKSRESGFNIKGYWSLVFCWIHSLLSRTSNLNNLRSDYPVCEWSASLSCPYLPRGCFPWIFVCSNQPWAFLPDRQRTGNSTVSLLPSLWLPLLSLSLPPSLPSLLPTSVHFYETLYQSSTCTSFNY